MTTRIKSKDDSGVRLLTIKNPPRGYLDAIVCAELVAKFAAATSDENIRAIVITGGIDGVFIRHYDVGEILAMGHAVRSAGDAPRPAPPRSETPVYDLLDQILACSKPTIAAINGTCMGGGCEIALACDIRVAAKGEYTIGLPEARLGIIPGLGGMQMLSRAVGAARAKEMVLRGRVIGPVEAEKIGLVDEVADDALERAMNVARDLATLSPVAMASIKQMGAKLAAGESLDEGILTAAEQFLVTITENADAMDRMQRFIDDGEDILAQ